MTTAGRPRIGPRVAVRLPEELVAALDTRAAGAGLSRAEVIRAMLRRALATGTHDGVDRTQIAHRLALSPAERLAVATSETRRLLRLSGGAA